MPESLLIEGRQILGTRPRMTACEFVDALSAAKKDLGVACTGSRTALCCLWQFPGVAEHRHASPSQASRQRRIFDLGYRLAGLRMSTALLKVHLALKAGFRPDQPRVPAGNADGGRWTDEGDTRPILVQSQGPVRNQVRRGGNGLPPVNLNQETRLALSQSAMRDAVDRARALDPRWRPRPQLFSSVEGEIRANEATRFEAELLIFGLTGRPPQPGPFAREWLVSPPPNQRSTRAQQDPLDLIGRLYGCHGCGSVSSLSPRGHFYGDRQMSKALGAPSIILPHCPTCSGLQGALVGRFRKGLKK